MSFHSLPVYAFPLPETPSPVSSLLSFNSAYFHPFQKVCHAAPVSADAQVRETDSRTIFKEGYQGGNSPASAMGILRKKQDTQLGELWKLIPPDQG